MPQIPGSGIADNSISASKIAAGTIVAGIIDGTLVNGAQFVAFGTTGEVLVYSGTPTAGNLICSISGMAGADTYGNSYPQGLGLFEGSIDGIAAALSGLSVTDGPTTFYTDTVSSYQVFRSNGTFTPSANGTVSVLAIGPGGNGFSTTTPGGGGGGASVIATDNVTASTPYTITVPAGGSGSPTTATFDSGTAVSAPAGANGTSTAGGAGGALGTGPTGFVSYKGGKGAPGIAFTGAGGGGAAGAGQAGQNAPTSSTAGGAGAPASGLFPASGAGGAGSAGAGGAGGYPGGGGGGGTTGGTGGNGMMVVIFSGTGAPTPTVYASVAPVDTTDPVTGSFIAHGVTSYNNTFAVFAALQGGILNFASLSGSALLGGTSGSNLTYTNTEDNNVYNLGRLVLMLTSDFLVTSGSAAAVTGLPSAGLRASGAYSIEARLICVPTSAAGTGVFSWSIPGTLTTFEMNYVDLATAATNTTAAPTFGNSLTSNTKTGTFGTTTFGTANRFISIDGGVVNGGSANTIQLLANCSNTSDTFTIKAGSRLVITPLG